MPKIVVVGGSSSNVGKTTLACRILRNDTSRAKIAMKVSVRETPCETRVALETVETLRGEHRDSHRLLDSGALCVVWVTTHRSCVRAALAKGLWMVRQMRPSFVVIESTSAGIHMRNYDESWFVAGQRAWKPWARSHLLRAGRLMTSEEVFANGGPVDTDESNRPPDSRPCGFELDG